MTEFYCSTCRKYKPLDQKRAIHGKNIPRCASCTERAEQRANAIKPQKAMFDKRTPIES